MSDITNKETVIYTADVQEEDFLKHWLSGGDYICKVCYLKTVGDEVLLCTSTELTKNTEFCTLLKIMEAKKRYLKRTTAIFEEPTYTAFRVNEVPFTSSQLFNLSKKAIENNNNWAALALKKKYFSGKEYTVSRDGEYYLTIDFANKVVTLEGLKENQPTRAKKRKKCNN